MSTGLHQNEFALYGQRAARVNAGMDEQQAAVTGESGVA